ncbi:hypothetical protein [Rhodanobacter sp. L36]|uniref:hypothetical protein n=1 Tax=Rhodanobacter sp. L36 TaxID=1747221 RepID=UPI0020B15E94|nr:hypothetical protein [Rhodanobacter sp. L36]
MLLGDPDQNRISANRFFDRIPKSGDALTSYTFLTLVRLGVIIFVQSPLEDTEKLFCSFAPSLRLSLESFHETEEGRGWDIEDTGIFLQQLDGNGLLPTFQL